MGSKSDQMAKTSVKARVSVGPAEKAEWRTGYDVESTDRPGGDCVGGKWKEAAGRGWTERYVTISYDRFPEFDRVPGRAAEGEAGARPGRAADLRMSAGELTGGPTPDSTSWEPR
jgi:hypothetical protein